MSFDQIGDVMHPTETCRGCAGTGIGQHVTPRVIQVIEGVLRYQWRLEPPAGSRRKQRFVRVTKLVYDQGRQQGVFYAPFAGAYAHVQKLLAEGFTYDAVNLPMEAEWACSWCHGTGQPQLSVETLELVMRRSSDASDEHNSGRRYD